MIPFRGQQFCGDTDPFLLPPAKTFCVDSNGIVEVSFNLQNQGEPGNYLIEFPDGTDTTYMGVEGSVLVRHRMPFSCSRPPGSPIAPTAGEEFYAYRGQLFIRRTDCMDEDLKPYVGTFPFNVIPNPIQDVRIAEVDCQTAPYLLNLSADLCSPQLVKSYFWYVDGVFAGETDTPEFKDFKLSAAGKHQVRLEVTTFSDRACQRFSLERELEITPPPAMQVTIELDSSSLCAPTVTIIPTVTARGIDTYQWFSNSADVSFSDATAANPTITVDNRHPATRLITLIGNNEHCGSITESFELTTYSGQHLSLLSALETCTNTAYTVCEQLDYGPAPARVNWHADAEGVTVAYADTECPEFTFAEPGTYLVTATGTDRCGLPFERTFPVAVRDARPLDLREQVIDTICAGNTTVDLMEYIPLRQRNYRIRGPQVQGTTFNPAGLSGPVELQVIDHCGRVYPLTVTVLPELPSWDSTLTVCAGESLSLVDLRAGVYQGAGTQDGIFSSQDLSPGSYTIAYTDTKYCGATGTFTVRVVPKARAGFTVASACTTAAGEPVVTEGTTFAVSSEHPPHSVCYRIVETGEEVCGSATTTFRLPAGRYTIWQEVQAAEAACSAVVERRIEVRPALRPSFSYSLNTTVCDSVTILFGTNITDYELTGTWTIADRQADLASPVVTFARPRLPETRMATVVATDGCTEVTDTLIVPLPPRFQVDFAVLNDNKTVCAGDTIRLVNSTLNAHALRVTLPDGTQTHQLPDFLQLGNDTHETLAYPISLRGEHSSCPARTVVDTVHVLPVSTRAAFQLAYDDNCSPTEVRLTNHSTPGALTSVVWGDTPGMAQPVGEGETITHHFAARVDTSYTIVMEARGCGTASFRATHQVWASPIIASNWTVADKACVGDTLGFTYQPTDTDVSIDWDFGDGYFSVDPAATHAYTAPGEYPVALEVVAENGCAATDTVRLRVGAYAGEALDASIPAAICVGSSLPRLVRSDHPALTYDYGNGLRTDFPVGEPYAATGDFVLTLTAYDAAGCRTDTAHSILVAEALRVVLQPDLTDTTIALGQSVDLAFSTQEGRVLDSIHWSGGGDEAVGVRTYTATPTAPATYGVMVRDQFGCSAGDEILVGVGTDYAERIYAPNVFSPNGDGYNERFGIDIDAAAVERINYLRVIDRWGAVVYECTACVPGDEAGGWDGTAAGLPAAPATYLWVSEVAFTDGAQQLFTGDVTLLR